jgi:hypothetical protein
MNGTDHPQKTWKRGPRHKGKFGSGVKPDKPVPLVMANFRFTESTMARLRALSEETNVTMREHAETAICRYLYKREREKKRLNENV